MKNVIRSTTLSFVTLVCAACGGGGGDGDDATNISGRWSGALTRTVDECSSVEPDIINVSHLVSQNEDAVILTAESGFQFLGNTVGENGFSVDAEHSTVGSPTCDDRSRIVYDSINNDSDRTADITVAISRSCPGQQACTLQYTGTVTRGPFTDPTPAASGGIETPKPTNDQPSASLGCPAINPNTASGAYEGDGGCGISSSNFTYNGNVVILEPFGSNGATSFDVNSANISNAVTSRSDLSIKGEAGYSCSMACSPPGTFTVKCFKEGGTSCVEKF